MFKLRKKSLPHNKSLEIKISINTATLENAPTRQNNNSKSVGAQTVHNMEVPVSQCNNLLTRLDGVDASRKTTSHGLNAIVDKLLTAAEKCEAALNEQQEDAAGPANGSDPCQNLQKASKDMIKNTRSHHKRLQSAIAGLRKEVDNMGIPAAECLDFSTIGIDESESRQGILTLIALDLYQAGDIEAADELVTESQLSLPSHPKRESFVEFHEIRQSLKKGKLEKVLEWTSKYAEVLKGLKPNLRFMIRKLQFLRQVFGEDPTRNSGTKLELSYGSALKFAQEVFAEYTSTHSGDIQKLMGSMMFVGMQDSGLDNPRYKSIVEECSTTRIEQVFRDQSTTVYGIPLVSHLSTCLESGAIALPQLDNFYAKMKESKHAHRPLGMIEQLPIVIENLPPRMQYHSVFVCPISREACGPENPPMLLRCGHVISQQSMARVSRSSGEFKCPTCPRSQYAADCHEMVLT